MCPLCDSVVSDGFVCSSDGITEASECAVKRRACLQNKDIYIVSNTPCGKSSTIQIFCVLTHFRIKKEIGVDFVLIRP